MSRSAIVLHSVHGLRPAVELFGEALLQRGFDVHLVDLFDGATTASIDEGLALQAQIDEAEAVEAVAALVAEQAAADGAPPLLAGFSFGAGVVGQAAIAGAPAAGLVMISEAWPEPWLLRLPAGLPVLQLVTRGAPLTVVPAAEAGARAAVSAGRPVLLRVHSGAGHLFMDADHPDHEPAAAADAADDLEDWLRDQHLP